jgi:hypothetical protein
MTNWNVIYDSSIANDFATTHGPVAAGGTLVNGWTDANGNVWTTASGILYSTPDSSGGSNFLRDFLFRPSSENQADGRIVVDIPTGIPTSGPATIQAYMRHNRGSNSTVNGITAFFTGGGAFQILSVAGGAVGTVASSSFTYNTAHTYRIDFSVVGNNYTAILTDTTSSTVLQTLTGTYTGVSSGSFALDCTASSTIYPNATRVRTYSSGAQGMSLGTKTGNAGSNYTMTVTGTGTTWTALTTFSVLSGGTGASVTTNSVNVAAQTANITITSGSAAGVLLIGNSTDSSNDEFSVAAPSFTLSPSSSSTSSTTTVTATGSLTAWTSGTTFSGSGLAGSSVATNSVNVGAQTANLTITTGSTAGNLTVSNNTDGANANFTVTAVLPITDAGFFWSPNSWYKNGSSYAMSQCAAAYFYFQSTTQNMTLKFDTSLLGSNALWIKYSVNGAPFVFQNVQGLSSLTLASALPAGTNNVRVFYFCRTSAADSWGSSGVLPVNGFKITGMVVDGGATSSTPSSIKPKRMICYGDSRVEGYNDSPPTGQTQDATYAAAFVMAEGLNAELGLRAFAGMDFTLAGATNVPGIYDPANVSTSSWNKYAFGLSMLDGSGHYNDPVDYVVMLNIGVNGRAVSPTTEASAVQGFLTAARAAAPNAWILLGTGSYESLQATAFTNGMAAYQAATPDTKAVLMANPLTAYEQAALNINNSSTTWGCSIDGVHPNTLFQGRIGGAYLGQAQAIISAAGGGGGGGFGSNGNLWF